MSAMVFDYRVAARHNSTPEDAMSDARSAVRWLRMNAAKLGINPGKIVGAGGSGGAHIIASAAMIEGFDQPGEDASVSCVPNALILFNPVLDTSKKGFGFDKFSTPDLGKKANLVSAIRKGLPPVLVFHGSADRVVPLQTSETFIRKMKRKKNIAEIVTYEGQGHGFFNLNVPFELYQGTLNATDDFLVAQGFLEADPEARLAGI